MKERVTLSSRHRLSAEPDRKPSVSILRFTVGDETFGLDVHQVVEITSIPEITRVPESLPFIEGVVNLRGKVVPVVDLRKRLGFPAADYPGAGRMIITRIEGRRVGLLADSASSVDSIPLETIDKVPPSTLQIDVEFIAGVGRIDDSLIVLLNLDKILTPGEKKLLAGQKKKAEKESR